MSRTGGLGHCPYRRARRSLSSNPFFTSSQERLMCPILSRVFSKHSAIALSGAFVLVLTSCSGSGTDTTAPPGSLPQLLTILAQPASSVASGAAISTVQVAVQDSGGVTVKSSTQTISIALTSGTGTNGAVLGGTLSQPAVNGVATFSNLTIDRVGTGYTLTATAPGAVLGSAATNFFSVTPGAPAKLVVTGQPTGVASLVPMSAVQVAVQDANGNVVTTATTAVTISFTSGTGTSGAVLGGTLTQAAVNGVATFNNLTVDKAGAGYTLTAAAAALTGATSSSFAITPGFAAKLGFSVQPTSAASGASISPAVQVLVQDAAGNTVSTSTNGITLAIAAGTGASGAVLGGTLIQAAVNGVATFSNVTIDKAGTGYQLTATSGIIGGTSNAFAVTTAPAAKLAFTVQPTNAAPGVSVSPAVQIVVQDAGGNAVSTATTSITVAITTGTGTSGAVLGGTLTQAAVNGVATFNNLTVDKTGTGYTLSATATALTGGTSSAFAITAGVATNLAFTVQPTTVASGVSVSPAVQVLVQDAGGNTVLTATTSVTIALTAGTGTSGALLGGTLTQSAVNGVATFNDLAVDKVGTGYTLTVSATGLTGGASTAFAVTAGTGTRLAVIVQPTNATSGAAITPAVQVEVDDGAGNRVTTSTASITLTIGANPGTATLGGTVTASAVSGVATFSNLTLNKIGTGYTLVAAATGLTSSTSSAFNVLVGAASAVAFAVQPPSSATVGSALSPSLQVTVRDASGNTVTTATTSITVALLGNAAGAILGGTTTVSAVAGVATFSNLTLDKPGQGFTLQATATGLTSVTSTTFVAIGPATKLAFNVQPTASIRNATIAPSVVVAVQDAAGNVVTNASTSVTMAIGTNAGGGNLAGTVTRSASAGLATFNDLSINAAGTGYTLAASAGSLTSATSSAFNIAAFGAAAKIGFIVQPSNAAITAVMSPAVQVGILDANGNTVTTSTASVTVALGANPGSAVLGGTLTATAVSGISTFANLTVSAAGTSYTLTGASTSLTSATSSAFNVVNPNASIKLGFIQQPTGTTAGSTIVPGVTVAVQNSSGTTVTTDNSTVIAITLASGPIGGTVRGTLSATAVNGVATFSTLNDTVSGTYSLSANASGLTSGTSASYTITAGVATKLAFVQQPTNTVAGSQFAPGHAVSVAVTDAYGNTVPSATNSVTVSTPNTQNTSCFIAASDGFPFCDDATDLRNFVSGGPALAGTLTVAAVSGIASFTDLRPRFAKDVSVFGLRASATGMSTISSAAFSVTPSAPTQVWVSVPTSDVVGCSVGGALLGSSGRVAICVQTANVGFAASAFVLDSLDNEVGAGSNIISLAIGSNPSNGTLTVANNVTATNGEADFTVSINNGGNGYTLVASTAGLTSLTSYAFNVAAFGTASRLAFTVQPSTAAAGAAIAPGVKACVQDGVGNTVTTATNSITIAVGTNPGSATLGGTLTAAAVSGCSTFANLTLSAAGSGYTLTASAAGLTGATSTPFIITP
jgi:hypothetical protein